MTKFLVLALILAGCGKSPLFNHRDAASTQTQTIPQEKAGPRCALELTNAKLCAAITWITKPTEETQGSFTIKFWPKDGDAAGPYVDPTKAVAVQLWMPSMGHGSSPVTVTRQSAGTYLADKVFFIMPGDWDIRLQLKEGKQVLEQVVEKITI